MEAEATFTVQQVVATAFMLYLCTFFSVPHLCPHLYQHPLLIDDASQLLSPSTWPAESFKWHSLASSRAEIDDNTNPLRVVPADAARQMRLDMQGNSEHYDDDPARHGTREDGACFLPTVQCGFERK